jgi:hypothetical protein
MLADIIVFATSTTRLDDPVTRALAIALIYIAFTLAAHVVALLTLAYWDHFVQVLLFDSKF